MHHLQSKTVVQVFQDIWTEAQPTSVLRVKISDVAVNVQLLIYMCAYNLHYV